MGNRRSSEIMRCLSQAFGSASAWGAFDALATPVPTACGDFLFFNSKKKEAKNAALKRRGACNSANRFCNRTTCVGLQGGLQEGGWLRDGLARCARWLCLMVFWDGLVAMAYLTYCVTSRESFAGRISHHIRATENQFSTKGIGDGHIVTSPTHRSRRRCSPPAARGTPCRPNAALRAGQRSPNDPTL